MVDGRPLRAHAGGVGAPGPLETCRQAPLISVVGSGQPTVGMNRLLVHAQNRSAK
jgi:hypothetical protein